MSSGWCFWNYDRGNVGEGISVDVSDDMCDDYKVVGLGGCLESVIDYGEDVIDEEIVMWWVSCFVYLVFV